MFFELDRPLAFDFEGTFEALGFAGWQAHLVESPGDPEQSLRFSFTSNTGKVRDVSRRGSLNPGLYAFSIRSDASSSTIFNVGPTGSSRFDFTFDLNPVPEPASMLLVGSGALGLLARARRRRTRGDRVIPS